MNPDTWFNNGNLPPGFEDEELRRKGKAKKGDERKRLTREESEELERYIKENNVVLRDKSNR